MANVNDFGNMMSTMVHWKHGFDDWDGLFVCNEKYDVKLHKDTVFWGEALHGRSIDMKEEFVAIVKQEIETTMPEISEAEYNHIENEFKLIINYWYEELEKMIGAGCD